MSYYQKFQKYKQQVSIDQGETWEDTGEYAPSGDPIGTYDTLEECMTVYRTIQSGTTCAGTHGVDKHNLDVYEVSYDNGTTWEVVSTSAGTLIEANSEDCGYSARTVSTGTTCVGVDKYQLIENQESYDYGVTWITISSSTGSLIEADSPDCGYVPPTPCECSAFTFDATSHTITDAAQSVTFNYSGCTKPDLSSASTYGWMLIANHEYNTETTVGYITANVSANTSSARTGILYTSLSGLTCQNLVISQQAPTPTFNGKYKLTLSDSSIASAACGSNSAVTSGEVASQYSGTVVSAEIGNCVKSIGNNAFYRCSGMTSIIIGGNLTSIGETAFEYCTSLTNVIIPNSVTSIGSYAFDHCWSLTNVNIPSGVTIIDSVTFRDCRNLVNVNIPSGVTKIMNSAFSRCSSLTSVTIPNSVTSIGSYAFANCSGLTSITVNATTPPTLGSSNAFDNTNDCPIYVPSASVNAYKSASGWSSYSSRITAIP